MADSMHIAALQHIALVMLLAYSLTIPAHVFCGSHEFAQMASSETVTDKQAS